ncbi:MAG: hypothetical protein OXN17_19590 [Candidatus Poribacteria bacterium]|nr:hypothetical protein [Candidatus Poribacteria bacterium]
MWNTHTGEFVRTIAAHRQQVRSLTFSPDGLTIASGGIDGTIRIWEISTGNNLHTYEGHIDRVNSVVFSIDGNMLASGSHDGTILLWDLTPDSEVIESVR